LEPEHLSCVDQILGLLMAFSLIQESALTGYFQGKYKSPGMEQSAQTDVTVTTPSNVVIFLS